MFTEKMVSMVCDIPIEKVDKADLSDDERRRILHARETIEGNMDVCFSAKIDPEGVEHFVRQHSPDVVYVDYVGLVDRERGIPAHQGISNNVREFKRISKEYDCAVIILAQLNRKVEEENREPRLSDLKDSGGLEEHADNVLMFHAPHENKDPERILKLVKQRGGSLADWDTVFALNTGKITGIGKRVISNKADPYNPKPEGWR